MLLLWQARAAGALQQTAVFGVFVRQRRPWKWPGFEAGSIVVAVLGVNLHGVHPHDARRLNELSIAARVAVVAEAKFPAVPLGEELRHGDFRFGRGVPFGRRWLLHHGPPVVRPAVAVATAHGFGIRHDMLHPGVLVTVHPHCVVVVVGPCNRHWHVPLRSPHDLVHLVADNGHGPVAESLLDVRRQRDWSLHRPVHLRVPGADLLAVGVKVLAFVLRGIGGT
mmetsp:Transcript_31948/g.91662  ORF Transcript_31948/g.91662 Transcript_31948/m.91662 type:complete len:223 (-) Transcript_31948:173-841(-)